MPLALYGHPFSSYTQKVLIALYENATPFELRCVSPDHPQHTAEWLRRWPLRKFPLLLDGDRALAESSIIIEYLQLVHGGRVPLLPADPLLALDVRMLDRFFDLHVMSPVQHAVAAALTGDDGRRQAGLAEAAEKLEHAYGWIEGQWACAHLGRWRAVHAGRLRRCAGAVLRRLDASHRRQLPAAARLPRAAAGAGLDGTSGGRSAAVPAAVPAGRPGARLRVCEACRHARSNAPKRRRSSLQMLAVARAAAVLCA
jgi:glutathione S-transferase